MLVIAAGMPRSASTWTYQVCCALVERYVPNHVFRGYTTPNNVPAADSWHVVKYHGTFLSAYHWALAGSAKVIYSYRDLRDVAFSWAHKTNKPVDVILREMPGEIMSQHNFWYGVRSCRVRYEEFRADPEQQISAISRWLGFRAPAHVIAEINTRFNFEANREEAEFQRQTLATRRDLGNLDATFGLRHGELIHWNHIRSGEVGGWRHAATIEQLQEMRRILGPWLLRHRYEADDGWVEREIERRVSTEADHVRPESHPT